MRGVFRRRLQRHRQRALHIGITHLARRARPRLIQQSIQPAFHETLPPLTHRCDPHLNLLGHLRVGPALGATQDHPRPQRQRLR